MIRFSVQAAYLLSGASREDAYSRTIFETVAVTNTDGECSVNARDLPWNLLGTLSMELSFLIFTFLKKARSQNKVQVD